MSHYLLNDVKFVELLLIKIDCGKQQSTNDCEKIKQDKFYHQIPLLNCLSENQAKVIIKIG